MTKKETIQVLQSIEDRAVDFQYMTACDWVAIAAAKRHLENALEVKEVDLEKEEPVSEDLEEAAVKYAQDKHLPVQTWQAFKAGAQWQKQQLIDKACEWLNNFYSEDRHCYLVAEDIKAFKQAMEEQQ